MNLNLKIAILTSGKKAYEIAGGLGWPASKLSAIVNQAQPVAEQDKEKLATALSSDKYKLFPSNTGPVAG